MINLAQTLQVPNAQGEAHANNSLSLLLFFCLSCLVLLGGCGSGSSNNAANVNNVNAISGVASKGIINGGLVRAYAVNDDGTIGAELDSDLTDLNGQYSLDIGDHKGPVIVEVTGGSYTDEATGSTVDNNTLRAVIPPVNGNKKVAITPLTEIAVQIAGATLTLTKINNANAAVSVLMGGADIIETQPLDINGDLSGATEAEKNYTMVLAAVSQMVEDGSVTDVADAVAKISADLADDGELAIDGSGTGDLLQGALGVFIASDENTTGLTQDDLTLDEALVDAAKKFVLTKIENEYDGDNVIDEIITYGYDATGNRIMAESDGDWGEDIAVDGVADYSLTTTYDANRKITMKELDSNGDGVINSRTTFTYDLNGNLTLKEIDSTGDGVINSRTTYTYDVNGKQTMEESDTNIDGTVDTRITWTRTSIVGGTRTIKAWDNNVDGVFDKRLIHEFDANGNMTLDERDDDGDGVANYRFIYEFDANGKKTLEDRDNNADGVNNHYTWTYDANGYLIMFESDGTAQTSPDGVVDARYIWTNSTNGKRVQQDSDTNGDGTFDSKQTWQYNASGQVIRYDFDYDLDGISDEYTNYTYDEFGNLIKEQGTETLHENITYTWMEIL